MKKIISLSAMLLIICINIHAQKEFRLMPNIMQDYIGKVNQEEFEKFVGEPVGEEDGFIVYEIESTYEKIPIAIRCHYRQSDGKLINVRFPTPSSMGYELNFIHLKGFTKAGVKVYKDNFGRVYRSDYKLGKFGMQVMNGIISYHTVK